MIVYISIGNSDNKLSQESWAEFCKDVQSCFVFGSFRTMHGAWFSLPNSKFQNACFCVELTGPPNDALWLRGSLQRLALTYMQDSISWAEVGNQIFIQPVQP